MHTTNKPKSGQPHQDPTIQFLAQVFHLRPEQLVATGQLLAPDSTGLEMSAVVRLQNQPEFWADAPWRLEPDQETLPVSFHVRDADIQPPGKGPWQLDMLRVEQRLPSGRWHKLVSFLPSDVPDVDQQGCSRSNFWVFGCQIPVQDLHAVERGDTVHLRAVFVGQFPHDDESSAFSIHLETYLAQHGLPHGRAAHTSGSRCWFHGDTHYHSAYTNDIKEFGGAIPEARKAGQAVGLDWLIITDHSCDLDEQDAGPGNQRRWDQLKADVDSPLISDDTFRCILGEEISLLGQKGKPLHLLAFGAMDEMIEGAFLPSESDDLQMELAKRAIELIIKVARGYAADVPEHLFGKIHPLDKVLEMLPAETLVFAAHPYDIASVPPARWGGVDLSQPRLTGYEFWNGRVRVSGHHTYNPFRRSSWKNPAELRLADAVRIARLRRLAQERWDPQLQRGIREWQDDEALPRWRPVFIGGSDAHGDFNYHAGWAWDYRNFEVDDNALGRARTVIHLPDHTGEAVPNTGEILAALKRGACVVTDGPLVECWLEQAGSVARPGDLLSVSGGSDLELQIVVHTTPEFGPAQKVDVITYFPDGPGPQSRRPVVNAGTSAILSLQGQRGYCRVEAQTTGPSGESFCCFTNPIWVRIPDGQPRQMRISFR